MLHRTSYIDGLRGCAVLGVIFCHAALLMPAWANIETVSSGVPWYWLGHALVDGSHGVDLFFVLSGFCLAYPTLQRVHAERLASFDVARFATHRLVRILPPYYLSIVVFAGFALFAWVHSGSFSFPEAGKVPALDILRQMFFFDRGTTMVNSNFWTLAVEFRWYFIFPICLLLWVRAPRVFGVLIAALVVLYWQTRLYSIDLGVLPAFLLGIVAADWQIRDHPIRRYALPLTALAIAIALLIEPLTTMPGPDGVVYQSFFLQSNFGWHLAAFFFVLAAGYNGWLKKALSNPAIVATGIASYSIYLMQGPVMIVAAPRLAAIKAPFVFALLVCIALVAGFAFWWCVEKSFSQGPSRARWHAFVSPYVLRVFAWLRVGTSLVIATPKLVPSEPPISDQPPLFPIAQSSAPLAR